MKRIDYQQCTSSEQLIKTVFQNAIIELCDSPHIIKSMEKGKYINHGPLKKALQFNYNTKKVMLITLQIAFYLYKCEDINDLFKLINDEFHKAIKQCGGQVINAERKLYSRKLPTNRTNDT